MGTSFLSVQINIVRGYLYKIFGFFFLAPLPHRLEENKKLQRENVRWVERNAVGLVFTTADANWFQLASPLISLILLCMSGLSSVLICTPGLHARSKVLMLLDSVPTCWSLVFFSRRICFNDLAEIDEKSSVSSN